MVRSKLELLIDRRFGAKSRMRGIVRYFNRKSTNLLKKMIEIMSSHKIIQQNAINPLFNKKTGVQSGYAMTLCNQRLLPEPELF